MDQAPMYSLQRFILVLVALLFWGGASVLVEAQELGGFSGGPSGGLPGGGPGGGPSSSDFSGNFGGEAAIGAPSGFEFSTVGPVAQTGGGLSIRNGTLTLSLEGMEGTATSNLTTLTLQSFEQFSTNGTQVTSAVVGAAGRVFVLDSQEGSFAEIAPFAEASVVTSDLGAGIRRLATSPYSSIFGTEDSIVRSLIGHGPKRRAAVGWALEQSELGLSIESVALAVGALARLGDDFFPVSVSDADTARLFRRLVELSTASGSDQLTLDPEQGDGPLPDISFPRVIWPFLPIGPISDPRTGLPLIDISGLTQQQAPKKSEPKKLEEQLTKLEEALAELDVVVSVPAWLAEILPKSDPNVKSNISFVTEAELSSQQILERWCDKSLPANLSENIGRPMEIGLGSTNNSAQIDVLITSSLSLSTINDDSLRDCLTPAGPLDPTVGHQIFGFEGVVPVSRVRLNGPLSHAHLARLFLPVSRLQSDRLVETESFRIREEVQQCKCTDKTVDKWIKDLVGGWLTQDRKHCMEFTASQTGRVRCSGLWQTIVPSTETILPSLSLGTPVSPSPIVDIEKADEDDVTYCSIDANLGCLPFQTYSFVGRSELARTAKRWCMADSLQGGPENQCAKAQLRQNIKFLRQDPLEVVDAQRSDLTEFSGSGLFLAPLAPFLLDPVVWFPGNILNASDKSSQDSDALTALRQRERRNRFEVIEVLRDKGAKFGAPIGSKELLSGSTPYVQQLMLFVPRSRLHQLAVSSYIRLIQKDWTPDQEAAPTLVTVSRLTRSACDAAPSDGGTNAKTVDLLRCRGN